MRLSGAKAKEVMSSSMVWTGLSMGLGAGRAEGGGGDLIWSARKGELFLHAALRFVRGGGDVEHVFDPVGAVGALNLPPVVVGVLETAVPVHTEAEEVPIEAI